MIRLRPPSAATVLAYLALFVALGGVAWGVATIGPADIENDAVVSRHIRNNTVSSVDVARDSTSRALTGQNVLAESLSGADVDEGTLFNDNSITGADVNEGSLGKVPAAQGAAQAANAQALQGRPAADFVTDRVGDITSLTPITLSLKAPAERSVTVGDLTLSVLCSTTDLLSISVQTSANNTLIRRRMTFSFGATPRESYSEADDLDASEAFSLFNVSSGSEGELESRQLNATYLNPTGGRLLTLTMLGATDGDACEIGGIAYETRLG